MSLLNAIQNANDVPSLNQALDYEDIQVSIGWNGQRLVSRGNDVVPLQDLIEKIDRIGVDVIARDRFLALSDGELTSGHALAERTYLWKQNADRLYEERHPVLKVIEFVLHLLETIVSGSTQTQNEYANRSLRSFRILFSTTKPFDSSPSLLGSADPIRKRPMTQFNHIHMKLRAIAQKIVNKDFEEDGKPSARDQFFETVYEVAKQHHFQDDLRESDPAWAEHHWEDNQEILREALLSLAQSDEINSEELQESLMEFAVFTN